MYKMEVRIRYSECGADNKIKIPAIINYFQDCTTENSEKLGVGFAYLREKKRAWILNSWQVFVKRRPEVGEEIEVSTWATGFKGVFGPRDFIMKTADGEELACAHSLWVYVDTETGRPAKPDQEEIDTYGVEEPLSIASVSRKIKLPEEAQVVDTFTVRKYHIDTNNHMNNSKYIELAYEAVPENVSVTGLRVEYKKAAVYGDKMILKSAAIDGNIFVGLCDEEENPYAIVEFIGE